MQSLFIFFMPIRLTAVFPHLGFLGNSVGKESEYNIINLGSISGSRNSPGEGNSNSLQYFCLENSMDRGAGQATVYGSTKSQT